MLKGKGGEEKGDENEKFLYYSEITVFVEPPRENREETNKEGGRGLKRSRKGVIYLLQSGCGEGLWQTSDSEPFMGR